MRRKPILRYGLLLFIGILTTAICTLLWHFRPLVATRVFTAFRKEGGRRTELPVYIRSGFPGEYWIQGPDRWFVVRPAAGTVLAANAPRSTPWLHFNHDMAVGVPLDDPIKSGCHTPKQTPNAICFADSSGGCYHFTRRSAYADQSR